MQFSKKGKEIFNISSTSSFYFFENKKEEWYHLDAGVVTHTCTNGCHIRDRYKVCDNVPEKLGGVINNSWTPPEDKFVCVDYSPKNMTGHLIERLVNRTKTKDGYKFNHGTGWDPTLTYTVVSTTCIDYTCNNMVYDGCGLVLGVNDSFEDNLQVAYTFSEGSGTSVTNIAPTGDVHNLVLDETNGAVWDTDSNWCKEDYCL